jgi:hypothetical protein
MKQFYSVSAWRVFKRKLKAQFRHVTEADLLDIESSAKAMGSEKVTVLERLQRLAGRPAFEIARLAEEAAEESRRRARSFMVGSKENLLGPIWLGRATEEQPRATAA